MTMPTRSCRAAALFAAACSSLALAGLLGACAAAGGDPPIGAPPRQSASPDGSVYLGWRLYNARCAACHGADASGPARVPGLLDRVGEMGVRRFASLVLTRYDWPLADDSERGDDAGRSALLDQVLERKESAFEMPAWQDDPAVRAHILDLYAYLSARADGQQPAGRPPRPAEH
jgi:hypothetical protein